MNVTTSIRNIARGAFLAAICCGAALTARADTEWMILPKAATGGLMTMHVSRDAGKKLQARPEAHLRRSQTVRRQV